MSQSTLRWPPSGGSADRAAERLDLVGTLAAQAMTWVAERVRAAHDDPDRLAQDRLHAAAVGPDPQACAEVTRALVADGEGADRICDVHIPEVVRRMGEEWVRGDLPFSAVTIGSARLQSLLRQLDLAVVARPGAASGTAGAILLVIPSGADHTLGPLVLASQLRRMGFSVQVSLGESPDAVAEGASRIRFDAVFLSATLARSLPQLIRTAVAIRAVAVPPPPVVLGGTVVAAVVRAREEGGDLLREIDLAAIDYVTCDLDEAMRLCGLAVAQ